MGKLSIHDLRNRWINLISPYHGNPQVFWFTIRQVYERQGYHNLNHIGNTLEFFDEFLECNDCLEEELNALQAKLIEFGIWFHDFIYIPGSLTNEMDSAFISNMFLTQTSMPDNHIWQINDIVCSTDHKQKAHNIESAVACDCDLAGLGLPYDEYMANGALIRQEFHETPDRAFKEGRKKFLTEMLKRKTIYQTKYFHGKYEASAVANMKRELSELS